MKNQVFQIPTAEADEMANHYFMDICGFRREGEKYQRLYAQSLKLLARLRDRIQIRGLVSAYPVEAISGSLAVLDGVPFRCNALEQIQQGGVGQLFTYIVTAGDFALPQDAPMIDRLYADIWGTAYVDAGLEVLKAKLLSDDHQVMVSFGPGYYGMDITQVGNFFQILDGSLIGVTLTEHSLMLPVKSCTGFLVAVREKSMLPPQDCASCLGNAHGCAFCQSTIKGKQGTTGGSGGRGSGGRG